MCESTTYYGQDTTGYTHIGTDDLKFRIADWPDLGQAVDELKRRCGKRCEISLYVNVEDGDCE